MSTSPPEPLDEEAVDVLEVPLLVSDEALEETRVAPELPLVVDEEFEDSLPELTSEAPALPLSGGVEVAPVDSMDEMETSLELDAPSVAGSTAAPVASVALRMVAPALRVYGISFDGARPSSITRTARAAVDASILDEGDDPFRQRPRRS